MSALRLMTIVGTRPEVIRLSEVIKAADRHFDHVLVHTGQNWDRTLRDVFFEDLGIRQPDEDLGVAADDLGTTMGNVIASSYECMSRVRPDALLVLGDTNSCLAAISAKRLHIPVFHMEAGNRCFDERLPEETNRRIVDHVADVNIAYSEHARRNLLAEGLPRARTLVSGSPMPEVLRANVEKVLGSDALGRLGLERGGYLLLSAHREENVDDPGSLGRLVATIDALADRYGLPILYSLHPRSARRLAESGLSLHPLVRTHEPLSFTDYNCLQANAACVVSDSGTLPEEADWWAREGMAFPAVSLRSSTERPEALEAGSFVMGTLGAQAVLQAVELAMATCAAGETGSPVADYADEHVSSRIVRIIQSHTAVVDEMVWRKPAR